MRAFSWRWTSAWAVRTAERAGRGMRVSATWWARARGGASEAAGLAGEGGGSCWPCRDGGGFGGRPCRDSTCVGDDKEGGSLEEDDLVGMADLAEAIELALQRVSVRDERVDHLRRRATQPLARRSGLGVRRSGLRSCLAASAQQAAGARFFDQHLLVRGRARVRVRILARVRVRVGG